MLVQLSSINSSHLLWPKLGFGHIYILSGEAVCMQLQVKWHSFGFTKVKVNPYITSPLFEQGKNWGGLLASQFFPTRKHKGMYTSNMKHMNVDYHQ